MWFRLFIASSMRARFVRDKRESGRILAVSFFCLASRAYRTPLITLFKISYSLFRTPNVLLTCIRLFRQPSHPFARFGTPTMSSNHYLCIVEQRRVHRRRLHPVLVIFWEDAVDRPASTVRRWSDHICANPMWCHLVQGLSCTYWFPSAIDSTGSH